MKNGVLLVKGKAGLGNRLLSVLGAILYGSAVRRNVCVDWSDGTYASKGVNAFTTAFRLKEEPAELSGTFRSGPVSLAEILNQRDVFPAIWRGQLERGIEEMINTYDPDAWNNELSVAHKYSVDFRQADPGNSVCVRWSYHDDLWDFFPQLGWPAYLERARFASLRETLHRSVALTPSILDHADQATATWTTKPMIGIHVRYTDNQAPLPQLLRRLKQQTQASPAASIFLATDSLDVQQQIQRLYPGRVLATAKLLPTDGTPLHHQHRGAATMIESMIDLILLSRCPTLIFSSRSTFGYCAALLSQADTDHLFDCLTHGHRAKRMANTIRFNMAWHRVVRKWFAK